MTQWRDQESQDQQLDWKVRGAGQVQRLVVSTVYYTFQENWLVLKTMK